MRKGTDIQCQVINGHEKNVVKIKYLEDRRETNNYIQNIQE